MVENTPRVIEGFLLLALSIYVDRMPILGGVGRARTA